jgi:hypothetical protein
MTVDTKMTWTVGNFGAKGHYKDEAAHEKRHKDTDNFLS